MIVGWFLDLVKVVVHGLLTAIPTITVPSWLSGRNSQLAQVLGYADGFGAWVPFTLLTVVVGSLLGLVVVSFGIKVTRIGLSFITLGGGGAG